MRGDVVNPFQPKFLNAFEDAETKTGAVDGNHDVGAAQGDGGDGLQDPAAQWDQVGENFRQAHVGDFLHRELRDEAGFGHAGAPDAGKFQVVPLFFQGVDQPCAKHVAAGLAGNEEDFFQARDTIGQGGIWSGQSR